MPGADLKYTSPTYSTSFNDSTDCSNKVSVILNAFNMVKLIRNCLGSAERLVDFNMSEVGWCLTQALEILQPDEGLHLGNRLTRVRIEWEKQKMKVCLAVQALNSSVPDALDFREFTFELPQFKCEDL